MVKRQRSEVNFLGEDRISNMPRSLIDSILELVPIQDAARTSILSTKWRYIWTTLPVLVFDRNFSKQIRKYGAFSRNRFVRIINQILFHHSGPVLKFDLFIPNLDGKSYLVNQWISFLSSNGIKELTVTNSKRRCELLSYLFSCSELTVLKVENCVFKPAANIGGFHNLRKLHLDHIDFETNSFCSFGSAPHLLELDLNCCTGVYNFHIDARNLLQLFVFDCDDIMLSLLMNNHRLNDVTIVPLRHVEGLLSAKKIGLERLISSLLKITSLWIDEYFIEFLPAETMPDMLPSLVNNLNDLMLSGLRLYDLDQLRSTLLFLKSLHNLKSLQILKPNVIRNHDYKRVINLLEAPNCLNVMLDQLHTVQVIATKGSKVELLFIKLLLAHSPSLENLEIQPSQESNGDTRFRIIKDVTRFPRASPKAQIIYLDP